MNKLVCPNCGSKKTLFFNGGPNPFPETVRCHCHELMGGCGWMGQKSELVESESVVYNIVEEENGKTKCVCRQE